MELENAKAKMAKRPRRRGPEPWLQQLAELTGYSRYYLSNAINGRVAKGPILEVVKAAREKGLIGNGGSAR